MYTLFRKFPKQDAYYIYIYIYIYIYNRTRWLSSNLQIGQTTINVKRTQMSMFGENKVVFTEISKTWLRILKAICLLTRPLIFMTVDLLLLYTMQIFRVNMLDTF